MKFDEQYNKIKKECELISSSEDVEFYENKQFKTGYMVDKSTKRVHELTDDIRSVVETFTAL